MNTKITRSTGQCCHPFNIIEIGYCIEPPKEVLEHALKQGYAVGRYRQAGETRNTGAGLAIEGTDMHELPFGIEVTATLNQIPFSQYTLPQETINEKNLEFMFKNKKGSLWQPRGGKFTNLFLVKPEHLKPEDKVIMDAAREFVETVKGYNVPLEYLTHLSN